MPHTIAMCSAVLFGLTGLYACQTNVPGQTTAPEQPAQTLNPLTLTNVLPKPTAPADPAYETLPNNKAQALSIDNGTPGMIYTNEVANQPTPIAAAMRALQNCEQARAARTSPSRPCEIRRRGDTLIHSTQELTEGLSEDRPALLWRLQAGSDQPQNSNAQNGIVYIAGSIHVLKPTLQAPQSYSLALQASDTLVFEIDEAKLTPAEMQALVARYGNLPNGQTLAELMSGTDHQRVVEYATSLGLPAPMLQSMKPAMLLLQLGVLEYISMGYLAEHGVESVFRAMRGDRDVLALETVEQQLAAATALPIALQTELLLETLDDTDSVTLEIAQLVRAWLAGDEQQLDALFNDSINASPAAQQWMDDLLKKRNVGMAAGVADLLMSDQTHFVLVGAAHLVGADSVIALLEAQGVTATRLQQDTLQPATH